MRSERHLELAHRPPTKDLLCTLSSDGVICSLSDQAAQISGWNEPDCLGTPFHSFIHPHDISRVKDSFEQISGGRTVTLDNVRCLARNDSYLEWVLSLVPSIEQDTLVEVLVLGHVRESDPFPAPELFSLRNPIARLYSEKSIASQTLEYIGIAKLMESLLANAPLGFALLDEELRFVCLNQTFSGMTGFSPEQQLGQPLRDLLPKVAHLIEPMVKDVLATGRPLIDHETILQRAAAAELSRHALISLYPIPGRNGTCGVALMALDITDRKRSEESLRKVSAELVRSNRALEHFSSIASHDLKEPLRTMSVFITLLGEKYRDELNAEAQEYINFAVSGAERMQRLIDKLLEYSTAGRVRAGFVDVDCTKILQTILRNLKVCLEESRTTLTYDPLPTVSGDEFLLSQVFQNLVANAIKYRRPVPLQIHVGARKEAGVWLFSVVDNGIGISEDQFSNIFAPFGKLHAPSEYAGSGLGLAICQKNIERHGGRIWVSSQEGKGSTFQFTIPVVPPEGSLRHGFRRD